MRSRATRLAMTAVLAVVLVVSGIGASAVMAQGASNPFAQIVAALQQLQASVDSVQQSVDSVGATSNFVITPAVIVESGIIDCMHINVTNADRHVRIQLIDASTGSVKAESSAANATAPGRFRSVGAFAPGGFSGTGYCVFTVMDGTKADIRASLTLTPNTNGDETTAVSVAAQ